MEERTCAVCSTPFAPRTSRQIYCGTKCNRRAVYRRRRQENPLPTAPEFTCPICRAVVPERPRTAGPLPTYCSRSCATKASYLRNRDEILARRRFAPDPKACAECGSQFTPAKTTKQKFCSAACGKRFQNRQDRASRPICSSDGCENRSVSGGLCKRHHPSAPTWSQGTIEARRASRRRKTQLRRARLRDPDAESIDRDEIGERDGWRCGLCGARVNRKLAWPHPKSASLDHIVPLSLGGKHARANVQISHLECNVAKGNRGGGEQLLLIG